MISSHLFHGCGLPNGISRCLIGRWEVGSTQSHLCTVRKKRLFFWSMLIVTITRSLGMIWTNPIHAYPARDLFGEPVIAPKGKPTVAYSTSYPRHPGWMHEFCDTDWTAERKAAANQ